MFFWGIMHKGEGEGEEQHLFMDTQMWLVIVR
jgi:hypothetical protein